MTEQEIQQTLTGILKRIAPEEDPEDLQPDDDIRRTLGIDSFDTLQFIVAFSDHFGIDTPEEDYGKITTMRELVAYIRKAQGAGMQQ